MNISAEQIETKNFGHLGLVAATINKLGIIEKIDEKLPVSKAHGAIVTMGRRVAAMILNGLGFYNDRLYMHSLFFQDKPISLLLGDDINSENLNDDALGRCLDEIYRYGSTKLLSEIAMEIGTKENLLGKSAHLDTSSFTVYGDYSDNDLLEEINLGKTEVELTPFEEIKSPPVLTYGHAKNKRSDLKQVIISLTTSGPAGLPIWMEALDGNKSDKKSFQETLRKMRLFQQQLADAPTFLYVADAELYVKDKLLKNTNLRWLTRVPERIKEAKSLCEMSEETFCWECIGNGYQAVNLGSNYGGLNQRWQLIYSEQAYAKEIKTFKKRVKKEEEATEKKLQKISAKLFSNQDEAKNELALLTRKFKYHLIEEKIIEIKKHKGRGKPKKGSVPEIIGYKIDGLILENKEKIARAKNRLGRFILATNEIDEEGLPNSELLKNYKEQSKTEFGFRFMKDKSFQVSSIFLKNPARIEALMVIMTLCLIVYNIGQYQLREALKENADTLPNQVNKEVTNPTLRWIFQRMRCIGVARISFGGIKNKIQEIVTNVCAICKKIICYFGKFAMNIYQIT